MAKAWADLDPRSDAYRLAKDQEVVRPNIQAVAPLVTRLRSQQVVIDPTALADQDGWAQVDYHRLWVEVVATMVEKVVFANGWNTRRDVFSSSSKRG